jgi:hypothetical protein
MGTGPTPASSVNRVVVGLADGKRLKGYIFNFSPMRDSFRLFPEPNSPPNLGTDVSLREVKAIFFVKDFAGTRERKDSQQINPGAHGRKLEVTFRDDEKIAGTTEAYNRQKVGFFMFPGDRESNNVRIFIVNASVREVKQL